MYDNDIISSEEDNDYNEYLKPSKNNSALVSLPYSEFLVLEDNQTESNEIFFTFGRFNPVTIGHYELFKELSNYAKQNNTNGFVFTSHSKDKKKNPLDYKDKLYFINCCLPDNLKVIETEAKTIFEVFDLLVLQMNYKTLNILVGDDRDASFTNMIKSFNKYYPEATLNVLYGKRLGGVVSATSMRQYALDGDFESFSKISPLDYEQTKMMFEKVRDGMLNKCITE